MSQNLVAKPKNKQKRNIEIEMGVQCCLYWTYFASRSFFLWAFCKHYSLAGHFAVQRILVGKLVGIQEDLGSFTINRWFTFLVPASWLREKNPLRHLLLQWSLHGGWSTYLAAWLSGCLDDCDFSSTYISTKKGKSESQHKVRVCTAPTRAGIQKSNDS